MNWSPDRIRNAKPDQIPAVLVDILIRFMKLHASIRVDPDPDPRTAASLALLFDVELEDWESSSQRVESFRWGNQMTSNAHSMESTSPITMCGRQETSIITSGRV